MNAGGLRGMLIPLELQSFKNPMTGETIEEWVEHPPMRAQRIKIVGKAVVSGKESVIEQNTAYYVRLKHPISSGWRVKDKDGILYDVIVEPNDEKQLKVLECKKVNE
ncbi:MAG: head-tail adaptor protein [Candidatus Amulumruptor caecigallinarius]|nr:head-tail adaptor protein [Candidatus Amulumruptor caecigallinarius]